MSESKMTYYEMIQSIETDLDKLYTRIGGLRDFAEGYEKAIFNDSRGKLSELVSAWMEFRRMLPSDRADIKVGNWKK